MIPIEREREPDVLAAKNSEWLTKFLAKRGTKPDARPDSSKYAHAEVVTALRRMSHGKCFYCESKPHDGAQVDHHVEVAEDPTRAFAWNNLYLSCGRCNQAKKAKHVRLVECVDPCALGSDPAQHLTFDDDLIRPRNDSARGRATIRKYALDDDLRNLQRSRALRELERARAAIQERRLAQGGRPLTADEWEILRSFAQPERPFALMLRVALRALEP
jgi:uncharacterized protein (TIGR02646 family)